MSFGSFKMPTLQKTEIIKSAGRKLEGLDELTLLARRLEELSFPPKAVCILTPSDLHPWGLGDAPRLSLCLEQSPLQAQEAETTMTPKVRFLYNKKVVPNSGLVGCGDTPGMDMSGLPRAGQGVGWDLERRQASCMKLGHLALMSSSVCWGPMARLLAGDTELATCNQAPPWRGQWSLGNFTALIFPSLFKPESISFGPFFLRDDLSLQSLPQSGSHVPTSASSMVTHNSPLHAPRMALTLSCFLSVFLSETQTYPNEGTPQKVLSLSSSLMARA